MIHRAVLDRILWLNVQLLKKWGRFLTMGMKRSLGVREMIQCHFELNGTSRIRQLPPEQFCRHGFVLGKASEAGFGNEMYKILTGAALSIMLNRSLIIGQTRFQGTTDAVAAQFFLKNIHAEMRNAAYDLFGQSEFLHSRPNVFGELMRVLISPSENVEEAVNWVLSGGSDPDIVLHMRMLMNRSVRAVQAALNCIKKAVNSYQLQVGKPRVVLVSDTPSLIKDITPMLQDFAEVLHFDYEMFEGNISNRRINGAHPLEFRVKDWGPAPRWVAFVDFFLASRARRAVISGAHRRVGTTYAQLIAALAAAHQLGEKSSSDPSFSFLSSFQSNLLAEGLRNQVGWGHVWNRYAGPLSCRHQPNQCAPTPLLPPGWWDGEWQSPLSRDIRRMEAFGVQLTGFGQVNESHLLSSCKFRKDVVKTLPVFRQCQGSSC